MRTPTLRLPVLLLLELVESAAAVAAEPVAAVAVAELTAAAPGGENTAAGSAELAAEAALGWGWGDDDDSDDNGGSGAVVSLLGRVKATVSALTLPSAVRPPRTTTTAAVAVAEEEAAAVPIVANDECPTRAKVLLLSVAAPLSSLSAAAEEQASHSHVAVSRIQTSGQK